MTSVADEKIEVKLLDVSGRLLSQISVMKDQTARFGDDLHPGVYMLEIKQGQLQKIIKIIKQ